MSPFIYSIQYLERVFFLTHLDDLSFLYNCRIIFCCSFIDLRHLFQIQVHVRSFNANNAKMNFLVYSSSLMAFTREVSAERFLCAGTDSGYWGHHFQQNVENTLLQAFILVGGALEK